ncbi:MAG TPA: AsmA family protein [Candidatus Binatia bacterium]|nr:AsmA family protein [Candidatus Binatia bacterium]
MRKLVIAGIVLVVLIVLIGFAIVNLSALVNRNKDYLIARTEEALGRNVEVADIGVTLWGGIGIRLKEFTLADDPSFSRESFIRAGDLQVNVKFLPLLKKELEIDELVLRRPVINIIRNEKGQFNFSTIAKEKEKKEREKEREKERKKRPEKIPPALLISLVDVDDGVLRYVDKTAGIDFQATDLDFEIKEIRLDQPIAVNLEAAVLGAAKQNLKIKGKVGPLGPKADLNHLPIEGDLELQPVPFANVEKTFPGVARRVSQTVRLAGDVGGKVHFSGASAKDLLSHINGTLNLSGVSGQVPQLPQPITDVNTKIKFSGKGAELPETLFRIGKSQVRLAATITSFTPLNLTYRFSSPELNLADLRATASGRKKPEVLREVKSDGSLAVKNGALSFRGNLSSPKGTVVDGDYTDLKSTTSFAGRVMTIESLSLGAFGGSLNGSGRYDMRDSVPRFAATTNIKGMDLTQIFHSLLPSAPKNLEGLINMDLDVTGAGKEWEAIKKALKGQGKAEVLKGKLLDVNLAENVLSGATGIPGVANLIPADVRKKYPSIFNSKDTEFKQLKGSATISDGKAHTNDLVVSAAEFETHGKGWFAFDQTVDMRGLLLLSERFSQDIISRARETKNLANDRGQIEIPFTLTGKLPGAKPRPDLGYIARAMQKGAVERGLEGLFRKKSRRGEPDTTPSQEEQPSGSREGKKREPKEEILRGLEKFFGR